MEMLLADAEKQANAAASALKERDNILAKLNQLENSDRVTDDSSVAQLTGTLQTLETEVCWLSVLLLRALHLIVFIGPFHRLV